MYVCTIQCTDDRNRVIFKLLHRVLLFYYIINPFWNVFNKWFKAFNIVIDAHRFLKSKTQVYSIIV